jgi:DNA-methyltransferase (dcm)
MRSVELFSGCGGLAMGISRAGFHHELMVEWNTNACETLAHNKKKKVNHVKSWPFKKGDVREINWTDIRRPIDLVAGGPPCQPFSIGGKHKGNKDARDMWPEAIRSVRELQPRAFLFENVRGITRPVFAEYLRWITTHLALPHLTRSEGETEIQHLARLESNLSYKVYDVAVARVNAADYGAAQKRHRVIIAGIRNDLGIKLNLPAPTHSRERLLWDQWITGEYWERHRLKRPTDGPSEVADRKTVEKLKMLLRPPAGKPWVTVRDALHGLGEPSGENNHLLQSGARVYPGHTGSPLDQPAKALKAGDHGVPGGENMMVRDDGSVRYFTVREAARLQGLSDDFQFPGSWTESMRQLGNAVPVQLAEVFGTLMRNTLNNAPVRMEAA